MDKWWTGCSTALSCFVALPFFNSSNYLQLEDSGLGPLQSGRAEHLAAMEGNGSLIITGLAFLVEIPINVL